MVSEVQCWVFVDSCDSCAVIAVLFEVMADKERAWISWLFNRVVIR